MKIFVDADSSLLVNLAVLLGEGTCFLKRDGVVNKNLWDRKNDTLDRIFVNVFQDFEEVQEFLLNFHLIKEKPKVLYVDLGIVKKKEVISVIALLASLQQVCQVKIFCIGKAFGSHTEVWNGLGRFFDEVFFTYHSSLAEIKCEKGTVTMNLIGDLMQNLAKIAGFNIKYM